VSGPAIAFCLFAWDMIKNVGLNSCVFLKLCSMFNAFMIFDGDPGADFDFPATTAFIESRTMIMSSEVKTDFIASLILSIIVSQSILKLSL